MKQTDAITTLPITSDYFQGRVSSEFYSEQLLKDLHQVKSLLALPEAVKLSKGADYVVKCPLMMGDKRLTITIKVFKKQPIWKDLYDKKHKSKAERSFNAAIFLQHHQIGTPAPIAWLDKWQGNRLLESYYICLFEPAPCFRDLVSDILWNKRDSEPLMELLLCLAPALRKMHDAGFMHGDMGNQNIFMPKDSFGNWSSPQWIDLNRCKISDQPLTAKERAFDISRMILPSAYLRWFLYIYSNHERIDPELEKYEDFYRKAFTRHRRNSKFRHPIRHLKRKKSGSKPVYPDEKNVWLWDEKTAQPMIAMTKKNKNRHRDFLFLLSSAWKTVTALPGIWKHYKALQKISFQNAVELKNRIGVALHPKNGYIEHEIPLHLQLGQPPVLIRFYHHENVDDWQRSIELIHDLKKRQCKIMVALIQDRQAVNQPDSWAAFLEIVIPAIADRVDHIEITHAYNRVKWGVWNHKELTQLMQPAFDLQKKFPQIKLTGPSCIDFEYAPVIGALKALPKSFHFSALSHLLYVDRRGAPENRQGKFSTLEKVTLLKALAKSLGNCDDKVIISEVNWPVKYTGIWSPVICPYITPKWRRLEPGEPEDIYAHYLLRYLMISLCSGHIEQVFWWRLSAHGYGLVDDLNNFRKRPAFIALQFLLSLLGEARFEKKSTSRSTEWILEFSKDSQRYLMAWTTGKESVQFEQDFLQAWDYLGNSITDIKLSGAPVYLLLNS